MAEVLGSLDGRRVLVLGLTYRHGVKELAYSRALPLIAGLLERSARPIAYDPLLAGQEIDQTGAQPWSWGHPEPEVEAIVTQTADPIWSGLDLGWFPALRLLLDGRNSLRDISLPDRVAYRGIGGRR
jgi:UDP-N-acetyl-D-glucosamine dehydrogenase